MSNRKGKEREEANRPSGEPVLKLDAKFKDFVNFEWDDSQKEAYGFWVITFDFWQQLNTQAAKGRRITVQFDTYHSCEVASCFERDVASPNAGYICTARGLDAASAISRLLFLVSELMPNEWVKPKKRDKQDKW
jgi:hypothetical protein